MWDNYEDPEGRYTGQDLTRITLRELDKEPFNLDINPVIIARCHFDTLGREGRKPLPRLYFWHRAV